MIINHNISSINSNRVLKFNNINVSKDMEKLSSGIKINRAADDASGLAVSEKMRSQIRGLVQAEKNAENEEKFQFIMVRSTTTGACYIVPKGYSYAFQSQPVLRVPVLHCCCRMR